MKLSPCELFKYSWRVDLLIEKYTRGDPFELVNGRMVQFSFSLDTYELLHRREVDQYRKLLLYDEAGSSYRLSDLEKTTEFGGKGRGSTTRIEDWEITSLNSQIEALTDNVLPLSIGGEVKEIRRVVSTPGTPKSDFHFIDKDDNQVFWCSHKNGSSPRDFQQWGGMTEYPIASHEETIDFVETIRRKTNGSIEPGTLFGRRIEDPRLKCYSVFGIDYTKCFGIQNVTILLQGPTSLVPFDNAFTLSANHIHLNGELPKNEYDPIFAVRYTQDRLGFGIDNARFMVIPYQSKFVKEWV